MSTACLNSEFCLNTTKAFKTNQVSKTNKLFALCQCCTCVLLDRSKQYSLKRLTCREIWTPKMCQDRRKKITLSCPNFVLIVFLIQYLVHEIWLRKLCITILHSEYMALWLWNLRKYSVLILYLFEHFFDKCWPFKCPRELGSESMVSTIETWLIRFHLLMCNIWADKDWRDLQQNNINTTPHRHTHIFSWMDKTKTVW